MSKRKRDIIPDNDDEKLEIDVNLPEPPSKKAKRKEKKLSKKSSDINATHDTKEESAAGIESQKEGSETAGTIAQASSETKRSQYGIWIGNLLFKVTKDQLRKFFVDEGDILEADVTRIHLPTAEKGQNKGFAYVDFTSQAGLDAALGLSEKLIAGRRCLIKNANSFEGRPAKSEKEEERAGGYTSKKEPSKRVFVGNLSFDITRVELEEHFGQAGQVDDLFLATFEDSGKCKGFGWVTFADIPAAENAVRGFIYKGTDAAEDVIDHEDDANSDEEKNDKKKRKQTKPRKWFINKIHGRLLRCEFAEDAHTRYSKRFGKAPPNEARTSDTSQAAGIDGPTERRANGKVTQSAKTTHFSRPKLDQDGRREERRKRFDARKIAPGKALADAPRATGAIVRGAGTKKTFD